MFKKLLSLLLAVMMIVSVMAVSIVTTHAEVTLKEGYLNFDASSTGWEIGAKDSIYFYVFGWHDDDTCPANMRGWNNRRTAGTNIGDGIWEFDASKFKLIDGLQYGIIFCHVSGGSVVHQTYNLLFDTTCLGDVAYCDGTTYENPEDSTKTTLAAFWKNQDPNVSGPELRITSIGNVVGTCPAEGKDANSIFVDFISVVNENTGKTVLDNARAMVVDVGTKTEQKLIDDIGTALGLTKDDIKTAFEENEVSTVWSYEDSTLPGGAHEHTPGEPVRENEVPATCKEEGSYDEVIYCTECGEEISRETKTIDKLPHTPGEPVKENEVVNHDNTTYDEVVYCTVCGEEISRTPVEDPIVTHTPAEKPVIENEVPASCKEEGSYDEVVYCSVCGEELSRETKTIDKLEHTPAEAVRENEVPASCKEEGSYDEVVYCSVCGEELSRETKTIDKLEHTPAEAVRENEVPASCTEEGSYDEVVYCSVCGEELSRETKTIDMIDHDIVFVEEVPATATKDGVAAHYECTVCHKYFSDATGNVEVDPADFVIKAEHPRGDANSDGEVSIDDATTIQRVLVKIEVPTYDEVAADADLDGEVDIIDVTLIQRVDLGITTFEKWDEKHAKV